VPPVKSKTLAISAHTRGPWRPRLSRYWRISVAAHVNRMILSCRFVGSGISKTVPDDLADWWCRLHARDVTIHRSAFACRSWTTVPWRRTIRRSVVWRGLPKQSGHRDRTNARGAGFGESSDGFLLGRLRPDVSRAAALDSLHATNARLFLIWRSSYQDEKATWGTMDLKARVVGDVGSRLLFVLAAVGCVLLIACANAINLLIARGLHRGRELAIRGALGASRRQLVQHVLVESGALAAGAALVGVAVAALSL
jgi:hypothetical protein